MENNLETTNGIVDLAAAPPKVSLEDVLNAIPRVRLQNGRPWTCVVAGDSPDTRRTLALALAAQLDPTFTPARAVSSREEYLNAYRTCPAGGIILYESPIPDWGLLSMVRHTVVGTIFVLPAIPTMAAPLQKVIDTILSLVEIDRTAAPAGVQGAVGAHWYEVHRRQVPTGRHEDQLQLIHPIINGVKVWRVWIPTPPVGSGDAVCPPPPEPAGGDGPGIPDDPRANAAETGF